jgi:hypothetical protein
MMQSRDFYSSLNEVQLNVKEINSLQVELSKKIIASINKNLQNIEAANKKPELLKALNSISDSELNNFEFTKLIDVNKINNLTSIGDKDVLVGNIKVNYDGIQFDNNEVINKSKIKKYYFKNAVNNFFSKIKNKISNELLLIFILTFASLVLLSLVIWAK